jgi:methyl-accepting chemotaxis protein
MENRRHNYLVNKSYQLRYMGWAMALIVLMCVLVIAFLHVAIWNRALNEFSDESIRNMFQTTSRLHDYEDARYNRGQEAETPRLAFIRETQLYSQRQREILFNIMESAREKIIYVTLPLLLLVGAITLFLSHRVAGPMYHFQKSLIEIAQKNLTVRVHLRKHDEAQLIAESFNQAIGELDQSLAKIKRSIHETQDFAKLKNEISSELEKFHTS